MSASPAPRPARRTFRVLKPGRVPYGEALALQRRLAAERAAGAIPDTLVVLEHPPTITLGRGAHAENVLLPREALAERGVELFDIDRGGDVTYHGPGQVVIYPILDLAPDRMDVRRYVTDLETAMIRTCADYGLTAGLKEKMIGTWLGGEVGEGPWRKIGAVGVHLARWITTHGLAFNVSTDLTHFQLIVPCGIASHGVTSLAHELGAARCPPVEEVMDRMVGHFLDLFDADLVG